ncbi:hypothetical protein [Roseospira goensis]|uniref:Rha family transcriptional regulator n=1 Tax=Roseospira goensis TaxID=391922 RepID=A0A7W6S2M9_9PROT|nr:hypothetical protein [Roseospira goensis]MBB4287606.1 hypothetical protein [Roseospira goensis]
MPLDASPLSLADLETATDEPRILDLRLAERLGYDRPADIRELVDRNKEELETYGGIFRTARKNPGRGRPGKAYFLNEGQALLVCMLSRTERAAAIRREVVAVFMAHRRGLLTAQSPPAPTRPAGLDIATAARLHSRIAQLEHREAQLLDMVHALVRRVT